MNKSSIEQMMQRISKLEEALTLIRDVARVSNGTEFYAMIADKALNDGEEDGES